MQRTVSLESKPTETTIYAGSHVPTTVPGVWLEVWEKEEHFVVTAINLTFESWLDEISPTQPNSKAGQNLPFTTK